MVISIQSHWLTKHKHITQLHSLVNLSDITHPGTVTHNKDIKVIMITHIVAHTMGYCVGERSCVACNNKVGNNINSFTI